MAVDHPGGTGGPYGVGGADDRGSTPGSPARRRATFDEHAHVVYAVALRLVGQPSVAEDITQDVRALCWMRADRFDPERGSVRSWLCSMARHRAVDWLRAQEARHRREVDWTAWTPTDAVDDLVLRRLAARELHLAVRRLAPVDRQLVELAFFAELTHREIGERLGLARTTVTDRLQRALGHLHLSLVERVVEAEHRRDRMSETG